MNRRQRLMASIRGETVDRPPVSFYEINGLDEKPDDSDPFNIFNHPSWRPLIELAHEKTDRIVMRTVPLIATTPDPMDELTTTQSWYDEQGRLFQRRNVRAGQRELDQPDSARPGSQYRLDYRASAQGGRGSEGIPGNPPPDLDRQARCERGVGSGGGVGRQRDRDDRHNRSAVRGGAAVPDGRLHRDRPARSQSCSTSCWSTAL